MAAKIGRNEPCWCGGGKKYEACHLDADKAQSRAAESSAPGEASEPR